MPFASARATGEKTPAFVVRTEIDVEHDLIPLPHQEQILQLAHATTGTASEAHIRLERACAAMHDSVQTVMPRVPAFEGYFGLLRLITFAARYVLTMQHIGKLPKLPKRKIAVVPVSLQVRHVITELRAGTCADARWAIDIELTGVIDEEANDRSIVGYARRDAAEMPRGRYPTSVLRYRASITEYSVQSALK